MCVHPKQAWLRLWNLCFLDPPPPLQKILDPPLRYSPEYMFTDSANVHVVIQTLNSVCSAHCCLISIRTLLYTRATIICYVFLTNESHIGWSVFRRTMDFVYCHLVNRYQTGTMTLSIYFVIITFLFVFRCVLVQLLGQQTTPYMLLGSRHRSGAHNGNSFKKHIFIGEIFVKQTAAFVY